MYASKQDSLLIIGQRHKFLFRSSSKCTLGSSRKNLYPPHGRSTEIRRVRGVLKVKILEAKYEAKLEFPGEMGDAKQNTFCGGSMDIFWNYKFMTSSCNTPHWLHCWNVKYSTGLWRVFELLFACNTKTTINQVGERGLDLWITQCFFWSLCHFSPCIKSCFTDLALWYTNKLWFFSTLQS